MMTTTDSPVARFDWQNPDYQSIYRQRIERPMRLRANPGALPALHDYYSELPALPIMTCTRCTVFRLPEWLGPVGKGTPTFRIVTVANAFTSWILLIED